MSAQRPYVRVVHGQERHYLHGSRSWTADDLDLIEELIEEHQLPASEIRFYFRPIVSAQAMYLAMRRAGIAAARGRGRPPLDEAAGWHKVRELYMTEAEQAEVRQHERDELMAMIEKEIGT